MTTLPRQIELVRQAQGISKSDLAEKADISRSAVTGALNEVEDVKSSTLRALATALGLEILVVPTELAQSVQQFVAAGGKALGQPAGIDAPLSRSAEMQREVQS